MPKLISEQQQHSYDEQLMKKLQYYFKYSVKHLKLPKLELELMPEQHNLILLFDL